MKPQNWGSFQLLFELPEGLRLKCRSVFNLLYISDTNRAAKVIAIINPFYHLFQISDLLLILKHIKLTITIKVA
jgi:hypothetical protein